MCPLYHYLFYPIRVRDWSTLNIESSPLLSTYRLVCKRMFDPSPILSFYIFLCSYIKFSHSLPLKSFSKRPFTIKFDYKIQYKLIHNRFITPHPTPVPYGPPPYRAPTDSCDETYVSVGRVYLFHFLYYYE